MDQIPFDVVIMEIFVSIQTNIIYVLLYKNKSFGYNVLFDQYMNIFLHKQFEFPN
ncbi:hypothetical protein HanIR_Chr07g0330611 [Helianthus annuus]|nr:hypothetical protein HanIR_Chr12g0568301 [Helianthus annuus]KAJ0557924.1 hypothetical protein HanIR_Chr07g0330611 [Helianthus annuus]